MADSTAIAPLLAVVGPTAVGKSVLSLALADRFNGEIVNADSMQLYRGLDIGTAKLTGAEQLGIAHHLLDIWAISHQANVAEYQHLARQAIMEIQDRGKLPILVGGSGLYVNAVLDDLDFPGTDPEIRQRWEAELGRVGAPALHAELARRDADAAEAILPGNGRRIVRALEVIELTGAPFAARLPKSKPWMPSVVLGLRRERVELDQRIETRVGQMWRDGLVAEVATLAADGLASAPTASRALGYFQVLAQLRGEVSEGEAMALTVTATRRFARKQISWFGRDQRVRWIDAENSEDVTVAASSIVSAALVDHS